MINSSANRIEWIDQLKGFAILTVVYYHIVWAGMMYHESTSCKVISSFFMGTFFFASGFLYGKRATETSFSRLSDGLWSKVLGLLLPTAIISLIAANYFHVSAETYFTDNFKQGYWFTLSLFEVLLIQTIIQALAARCFINRWYDVTILAASLSLYYLSFHIYQWCPASVYLSFKQTFFYFPYFAVGIVLCRHREMFYHIIDKNSTRLFVLCASFFMPESIGVSCVDRMLLLAMGGARILLLIMIFRSVTSSFGLRINNILSYLGRNSLEIYFLHFFFIFSMPWALELISEQNDIPAFRGIGTGNKFIIEFIITAPLTVFTTILSLTLARIISINPIAYKLLFGKTINK